MIKKRVIIIGSSGIICENLKKIFKEKKIKAFFYGRQKADLTTMKSTKILKNKIKKNDKVIFVAAKAPAKNYEDFYLNILMLKNFLHSVNISLIKHFIYISSDAVYGDYKVIKESSRTNCNSIHGLMHLTRELILRKIFNNKLCILRPTLIFGKEDKHSGYGPNQFYKLTKKNKNIFLFGKGEEKRDHIYSRIVVSYIYFFLKKELNGIFNLASGQVTSFYEIAKWFQTNTNKKINVLFRKRKGPMPHKGYRSFNTNLIRKKIKEVKVKQLEDYLSEAFLK